MRVQVHEAGEGPLTVAVDDAHTIARGDVARGVLAHAREAASLDHQIDDGVELPLGIDRAHAAHHEDVVHGAPE